MAEPSQRSLVSRSQAWFTFSRNVWTNISLVIAVAIGLFIVWHNGYCWATGAAAFGAALGVGGVLGFLFGIPGTSQSNIQNVTAGTFAINSGANAKSADKNMSPPSANQPTPDANAASNLTVPVVPAPAPNADPNAAHAEAAPDAAHGQTTVTSTPVQPAPANPSNLEQVAEWVTKLLLGGGLTQMQKIPPKIWQWSHSLALGILGGQLFASDALRNQVIEAQQAFAAGLLVYGFILGFFSGFLITKLQLGKAIAN